MQQADAVERARRTAEDARGPTWTGGGRPRRRRRRRRRARWGAAAAAGRARRGVRARARIAGRCGAAAARGGLQRAPASPRPWTRSWSRPRRRTGGLARRRSARGGPRGAEAAARRQRGARRRRRALDACGVSDDGTSTTRRARAPAPGPAPAPAPGPAPSAAPARKRPRAARAPRRGAQAPRPLCDRVRIYGSASARRAGGAPPDRGSTTCLPVPADRVPPPRRRPAVAAAAASSGGPAAAPRRRRALTRGAPLEPLGRRTSGCGASSAPRSRRRALQASRQGRDGLGRVQREPPGRRAAPATRRLSVFGVLLSAFDPYRGAGPPTDEARSAPHTSASTSVPHAIAHEVGARTAPGN